MSHQPTERDDDTFEVILVRAGVVLIYLRSHFDARSAREVGRRMVAAAPTGPLHLFFDASDLSTYDNEARVVMVDTIRQQRARVVSIVVFTKSALVRMGAAVANMALGGLISITPTKDEFDRLLADLGRSQEIMSRSNSDSAAKM